MTDELLRLEAEWMLKFIEHEWQGCKPYSRFARSLPLVLKDYLEKIKPGVVGQDDNGQKSSVGGVTWQGNSES